MGGGVVGGEYGGRTGGLNDSCAGWLVLGLRVRRCDSEFRR